MPLFATACCVEILQAGCIVSSVRQCNRTESRGRVLACALSMSMQTGDSALSRVTCRPGVPGLLDITNGRALIAVEVVEGREEAGALVEGSRFPCGQLSASGGHRHGPCHTSWRLMIDPIVRYSGHNEQCMTWCLVVLSGKCPDEINKSFWA